MLSPMSPFSGGIATVISKPALFIAGGSQVASAPGWANLCGNMAPIAAMVVFFAPFPTLSQVAKKDKMVGALPLLPYSSMIANCFLWTVYGILKNESKIWGTNLIGFLFGLFYFARFTKFAPSKAPTFPGSVGQHITACLSVIAASVGVACLASNRDATIAIGNLAIFFCIAMFGSPLASLKTVLETKSAKSIPLPFTLATVLNCFLWSVAGLFQMKDVNVYFPNLLGLAFGIGQVALKVVFGDSQSEILEKRD